MMPPASDAQSGITSALPCGPIPKEPVHDHICHHGRPGRRPFGALSRLALSACALAVTAGFLTACPDKPGDGGQKRPVYEGAGSGGTSDGR